MKFEKFLKQTGTHGQIYTRDNGDRIEIGINNCDFGLLEKSDINLVQGEIEESDKNTQYLLVLNRSGEEVIGFIESVF